MSSYGAIKNGSDSLPVTFVEEEDDYIEISTPNFGDNSHRGRTLGWQRISLFVLSVTALVGVVYTAQVAQPAQNSRRAEGEAFGTQFDRVRAQKTKRLSHMNEEETLEAFNKFATAHKRDYTTEEERSTRLQHFKSNLELIDKLNDAHPLAVFGINEHADKTPEERQASRMAAQFADFTTIKASLPKELLDSAPIEFDEPYTTIESWKLQSEQPPLRLTGLEGDQRLTIGGSQFQQSQVGWASYDDCAACRKYPDLSVWGKDNMPPFFDWRQYYETPVVNQGACGMCWAVAAAADVEGSWFLATGEVNQLAPQMLVSCDQRPGVAEGCNGGFHYAAMQYISKTGGLVYEEDYPLLPICSVCGVKRPAPTCDVDTVESDLADGRVAHIGGWQMVAMGSKYEDLMATVLVKNGPIVLALNAIGMEYYVHGIVGCPEGSTTCALAGTIDDGTGCDPMLLDHAVLLVGYGEQDGVEFWVIKNSWASTWGEDGYYRVIKGQNHCGLANFAITSVVKDPTSS